MGTGQAPAGSKIAVIENDALLSEALVLFLQLKGWSVESFGSGEESPGAVDWGDFTAVICNFVLPREDGLSVLRRVREASDAVVTLLLTTYCGEELSKRAASAGVDRILFKPLSTTELEESLEVLTANRSGRKSAILPLPH